MFYYAEINSEYQVINKHCLSTESTNPNYILITEDLYNNGNELGDIVGQFYNALLDVIEIVDPGWDMGQTCWMRYKDSQMRLSTKLDNMDKATSLKADENHTHTGYASSDDLQELEDIVDTKANVVHNHTEYAPATHSHSEYALQTSVDALEVEIDGKANSAHSHTEYASSAHEHDEYAEVGHNHNASYAPISHSHTEYVTTVNFNALETEVDGKADSNHVHSNYATVDSINELSSVVSGKANTAHSHNDIYYTETEINDKLATKADSSHNHTGVYDVSGAAASALSSAQTYTDEAIDALSETVATKANSSTLNSHTGNTAVHITSEERDKLSGIAEGANNYILPSAGTSLGGVKSGGDVTISSGVITVNDDSHNHIISNVDGLQSALDSKAASGHNHDGVYYTETEVDVLLEGKANSSHTHTISNITNLQSTLDGKANTSHGVHVSYSTTAPVMDGSASVGTASTVARSDHKHPTDTSRAAQTSLDSHTSNKSNPHGVTLAQLGVTATTAEVNYVDGVTSNIQTQLNAKASSSHTHGTATTSAAGLMSASDKSKLDGIASGANAYTLPTASSTLGGVKTTSTVTSSSGYTACPIIGGVPYYKDTNTTYNLGSFGVTATAAELNALDGITATVTELNYVDGVTSNIQTQLNDKAASSHTHNYAGSSSAGGAATSANKLATARTISLTGDVSGSTSFDGSGNVSITATVADDSHNHTIANVDGLQTALNGKSATSHNHNSAYISKDLQMTADNGDISISFSGKNVVNEFKALGSGMYTAYSPVGCTNNPNSGESFRFMIHKTGTANYGWVMAYGAKGSVYTGYIDNGNWQGWKAIWEYAPAPLWSGGANGGYYMTAGHTVTPTKKLSECRNGWALLWSDYDVGGQANNTDFYMSYIYKRAYTGQVWGGGQWYCDIPSYSAGTATDSEQRVIKLLNIYDAKIVGTENNAAAPRNDVVLRAVYEF